MKNGFVSSYVFRAHSPKVDQNKRFLKMVRINSMLDDGGG